MIEVGALLKHRIERNRMRCARAFYFVLSLFLCVFLSSSGKRPSVNAYANAAYAESSYLSKETPSHKPLIILDAGHGGTDEGAKVRAFQEKKVTMLATLLTKKHLEELGYRVLLTRTKDAYISLPRRVSIANKAGGVLFVSIHFNSARNVQAKGIEVFYYGGTEPWRSRASQRLASCVLGRVIDLTKAHSRGVKQGNFHVIRETQMPAVLVEGGFITNAEERNCLKDRNYLNRLGLGIAEGVDRYLKS